MTRLADVTWVELGDDRRDVLVLPLGAHEQHGPHLPLDTDAFLATAVAERVEAARPDLVDLAPTVAIGASGEHADFPGTLSVGTTVVRDLVVEFVRHAGDRWQVVVVVNGHGGNAEALATAAATCHHEGRRLVVAHLAAPGMDAHAGRAETSLVRHLAPDRVRGDRVALGVTTPIGDLLPRLRRDGVRAVTPDGVLGDPTGADADEGARLLATLVERVLVVVDDAVATNRHDG